MPKQISVKECLSFGWETFKKRPWFFVATFVIYMGVEFMVAGIQKAAPGPASFLISIISSVLLYSGLVATYLKAHDDVESASLYDLWNPNPFVNYLGVSVLLFLAVGLGLVLLIVPGIILGLVFSFAGFLVVERGMNPIDAMKESKQMTTGNLWALFLLGCAVLLLAIIGMLPLLLGLFVVAPVAMLASIHAYRTLGGGPELEVVSEDGEQPEVVAERS